MVRHNHPVRVVEVPNIDRYAAEWDELVAAMHLPSPFLRSWWLGAVDEGAARTFSFWTATAWSGGYRWRSARSPD